MSRTRETFVGTLGALAVVGAARGALGLARMVAQDRAERLFYEAWTEAFAATWNARPQILPSDPEPAPVETGKFTAWWRRRDFPAVSVVGSASAPAADAAGNPAAAGAEAERPCRHKLTYQYRETGESLVRTFCAACNQPVDAR